MIALAEGNRRSRLNGPRYFCSRLRGGVEEALGQIVVRHAHMDMVSAARVAAGDYSAERDHAARVRDLPAAQVMEAQGALGRHVAVHACCVCRPANEKEGAAQSCGNERPAKFRAPRGPIPLRADQDNAIRLKR